MRLPKTMCPEILVTQESTLSSRPLPKVVGDCVECVPAPSEVVLEPLPATLCPCPIAVKPNIMFPPIRREATRSTLPGAYYDMLRRRWCYAANR